MAEIKKKATLDNGVAGLRAIANILTAIAVFGFAWAFILALIESISWGSFGCFAVSCFGAIILRFILLALASIAEAASCYMERNKTNEQPSIPKKQ